MDEVRLGGASLHVLSVVRGLPSEAPVVAAALGSVAPDVLAVSIAPEEVDALRTYTGGPAEPENFEEEIYVAGLSAWEAPVKPPPCFVEAVRRADAAQVLVEGIDMDESTYTDAYTACVSAMELVLRGRVQRRLARKRFLARSPQEFVLEWDREVNRAVGFARLQREREAHMARRLRELVRGRRRVLAVIEVERAKGVLTALRG